VTPSSDKWLLRATADRPRLLFLVTEDWYFWSHRRPVARAARDAGFEVLVATRVTNYRARIEAEGFAVHPLKWRRSGSGALGELRGLLEVIRLYRRLRPTIVHHIAIKPTLFGATAARMTGPLRVVNAINGLGFVFTSTSVRARLLRLPFRFFFRHVVDLPTSLVLFQNEDNRRVLVDGGYISRARTAIVRGSGVDTEHFAALPDPVATPVHIAVVSRMLASKGIETVVQASRLLRDRGVDHRLLLVGDPDPHNPDSIPEALLRRWNDEPQIEWLGHRDDVRKIWADAHIAVLASYGEGLPKSLLEAASCARPIVATDVSGCREIVRDGVNGFLVPVDDATAVASALERLILDPKLRETLGARSRALASEFSDARVAAALMEIYRGLLN
jgi:glycosyltransferase involved in cell wall biosynthesis